MKESIKDIQEEIISDFELFDDWADKYGYIVELGKKVPALPEEHKIEKNIIKGCQSNVWLIANLTDGKVVFKTDSDAIIVKGLIYLLTRVLSDQTPADIIKEELYFIDKIGMSQHLSQTRANGLAAMVKQMKLYALVFKTQLES